MTIDKYGVCTVIRLGFYQKSWCGGLGGIVVEFPVLSHFTQGSWVQTPIGSKDFLTSSISPCRGGCAMGGKKCLAQKTRQQEGHTRKKSLASSMMIIPLILLTTIGKYKLSLLKRNCQNRVKRRWDHLAFMDGIFKPMAYLQGGSWLAP